MEAIDGIQFLTVLLGQDVIDADDITKAIEIAERKSPSAAITLAQRHFAIRYGGGRSMTALTYGKGVRWLAVLRRDQGQNVFLTKAEELQALAGR